MKIKLYSETEVCLASLYIHEAPYHLQVIILSHASEMVTVKINTHKLYKHA